MTTWSRRRRSPRSCRSSTTRTSNSSRPRPAAGTRTRGDRLASRTPAMCRSSRVFRGDNAELGADRLLDVDVDGDRLLRAQHPVEVGDEEQPLDPFGHVAQDQAPFAAQREPVRADEYAEAAGIDQVDALDVHHE